MIKHLFFIFTLFKYFLQCFVFWEKTVCNITWYKSRRDGWRKGERDQRVLPKTSSILYLLPPFRSPGCVCHMITRCRVPIKDIRASSEPGCCAVDAAEKKTHFKHHNIWLIFDSVGFGYLMSVCEDVIKNKPQRRMIIGLRMDFANVRGSCKYWNYPIGIFTFFVLIHSQILQTLFKIFKSLNFHRNKPAYRIVSLLPLQAASGWEIFPLLSCSLSRGVLNRGEEFSFESWTVAPHKAQRQHSERIAVD